MTQQTGMSRFPRPQRAFGLFQFIEKVLRGGWGRRRPPQQASQAARRRNAAVLFANDEDFARKAKERPDAMQVCVFADCEAEVVVFEAGSEVALWLKREEAEKLARLLINHARTLSS